MGPYFVHIPDMTAFPETGGVAFVSVCTKQPFSNAEQPFTSAKIRTPSYLGEHPMIVAHVFSSAHVVLEPHFAMKGGTRRFNQSQKGLPLQRRPSLQRNRRPPSKGLAKTDMVFVKNAGLLLGNKREANRQLF